MEENILYWLLLASIFAGAIIAVALAFLDKGPIRSSLIMSTGASFLYSAFYLLMLVPEGLTIMERTIIGNGIFFFANAMVYSFGWFGFFFSGRAQPGKTKSFIVFSIVAAAFAVAALSGGFVSHSAESPMRPEYGLAAPLFLLSLLFSGGYVFFFLLWRSIGAGGHAYDFQAKAILGASLFSAIGIGVGNGLLPQVLGISIGKPSAIVWVLVFYAAVLFVLVKGEAFAHAFSFFRWAYEMALANPLNKSSLSRLSDDLRNVMYDSPVVGNQYVFYDASERPVHLNFQGATRNFIDGMHAYLVGLQEQNRELVRGRQERIDALATGGFLQESGGGSNPELGSDKMVTPKVKESLDGVSDRFGTLRSQGSVRIERILRTDNLGESGLTEIVFENPESQIELDNRRLTIAQAETGNQIFTGTVAEREVFLADGQLELDAFNSPEPGIYWKYRVKFQFLEK